MERWDRRDDIGKIINTSSVLTLKDNNASKLIGPLVSSSAKISINLIIMSFHFGQIMEMQSTILLELTVHVVFLLFDAWKCTFDRLED